MAETRHRLEMPDKPRQVVERNIGLLGQLMQYLLEKPELLDSLPADFELVILPDDDPELRSYNLELLSAYQSEGKPVVFVRTRSSSEKSVAQAEPSLYVPLSP